MRKLIDIKCGKCGEIQEDKYVDLTEMDAHECGGYFERVVLNKSAFAHGDDIPGGFEVKHLLCYPDGTPKKFYSKKEIEREAAKRGYHNHVEHIGSKGSDKNPHTQRWI